jgi:hypothetical protein
MAKQLKRAGLFSGSVLRLARGSRAVNKLLRAGNSSRRLNACDIREAARMTEKEALQVLTGTRDDYNDYARALNIAIRVLREHVAEIDKKSQNQRREREADYESNKHY